MNQHPKESKAAHPTDHEPARYCRRCGYELRGFRTSRCPECGTDFDPGDSRTFLCRPLRRWLKTVKRAAILLTTFVLLLAAVWGWFFWGWYSEQRALTDLKAADCFVAYTPIVSPWLKEHLGPAGFVMERVTYVGPGYNLAFTDISPLARLPYLQIVRVEETSVSDISPLLNLKPLRELLLPKATTTEEQVTELQRALPSCVIERQ